GNKKANQWLGTNMGTSIYANPINGDFTIETSGNVNLALKGTVLQRGLSAASLAANNLRGFGVPVAGGTLSASIVFGTPEPDANYAILMECDWLTVKAVHNKSSSGFTVQFATGSPGSVLIAKAAGGGRPAWRSRAWGPGGVEAPSSGCRLSRRRRVFRLSSAKCLTRSRWR